MTRSLFPPVHPHLPGGVPSKLGFKDSVRVCQVCLSRASQAEEIARLRHRIKPALFSRWSTARTLACRHDRAHEKIRCH